MTTHEVELRHPLSQPFRAPVVNWVWWRDRLAYLAMSLIVAWHTFAMVVAPAPAGSGTVLSLRVPLQPYLSLFRLDNGWGFFVPVGKHSQFRYVIEDAHGNNHTFLPTETYEPIGDTDWPLLNYVWWRGFKYMYEGIMEVPEARADVAGAYLCRRHASLEAVAVTLIDVQELDYWPEDYLRGKHPLDPEFVTENTLVRIDCRNGSAPPRRSPIRAVRPRRTP